MTSGARLPFVVTFAALLVGAAAPARGQSQPTADAVPPTTPPPEEGSTIKIIEETPPLTAPIPDPGPPPQQVQVLVHRRHEGLCVAGGALFSATYLASLMVGFYTAAANIDCEGCGDSHAWPFVVPVGGPLLAWLTTPEYRRGSPTLWVGWTTAQAVGAAMLTLGILGHDVTEWRPLDGGPRVSIVPVLTPNSGALSLDVIW